MEDKLITLLVRATRGVSELETVSIYHSAWGRWYHFTPSIHPGFDGINELTELVHYQYMPIRVDRAGQKGDLSQRFEFTFQDLNEQIAPLLDQIPLDTTEKPIIELRSYTYDEISTPTIQDGPYRLTGSDTIMTREGFKTTATPRRLIGTGTGRRMTVARFPMMKGFT